MNKTKKLLFMLITLFAFSAVSYAVEVSLGASTSLGVAFLRGKNAKDFSSMLETLSSHDDPYRFSYTPYKIDLMLEVLPFLAIETGAGWETTLITYNNPDKAFSRNLTLGKSQVSIPIMLRGQYEYKIGVTYVAVGVKLGIPLGTDYFAYDYALDKIIESSDFAMDVSFAIGQEFRVGVANYLGIRISYDLNVIQNFNTEQFKDAGLGEYTSHFMDDVEFAITYRYAFNSKWKKEAVVN